MKLTLHTDYALRILLVLAGHPGRRWSLPALAAAHDISLEHLRKVGRRLAQLGVIRAVRGRGGGVELVADPMEVSVGQVVRWMEPDLAVVECLGDRNTCRIDGACRLKGLLARARAAFLQELDQVSIAEVSGQPGPMMAALGLESPSST